MSSQDLDHLLEDLSGVGQLSSRGEFTLDAARASVLLEKYQLPTPSYFMLHAVGAAVASGATLVEAKVYPDLFQLTFDGEPFSPNDASECVASLWLTADRPEVLRLQELAIARGGAMQWGAREFTLENLGEGRQRLRAPRAGWMKRLGRIFRSEDLAVLLDHLVPTPTCEFRVNGKPLAGLEPPPALVRAFAVGEASVPLLQSLPKSALAVRIEPEGRLDGQGLICQLPRALLLGDWASGNFTKKSRRSFWPGFMDVVLNGRLYRCPMPPGWNDWWGVFYLDNLQRDLSFSYLAERDLDRLRSNFERARGSGGSVQEGS